MWFMRFDRVSIMKYVLQKHRVEVINVKWAKVFQNIIMNLSTVVIYLQ
jgi:hypothetical protein